MAVYHQHQTYDPVFRPVRLWLFFKNAILSAIALACILLTIYLEQLWWLGGAAFCILTSLFLICQYKARRVIIRDKSLVYCHGVLALREQIVPLWRVDFATRQSLLGRALNYGAVWLHVGDETIYIPQIAMLKQFRNTLIEQQNALVEQANGIWLAPQHNNRHGP